MEYFELPMFKLSRESTMCWSTFDRSEFAYRRVTVGAHLNAAFEVTIEITFDKGLVSQMESRRFDQKVSGLFPYDFPLSVQRRVLNRIQTVQSPR